MKFSEILTAIRHHVCTAISILVCIAISITWFGCESKTKSLVNPEIKISRAEIQVEYDRVVASLQQQLADLNARYTIGIQALDKQDALKNALIGQVTQLITNPAAAATDPLGYVIGLLAVLGIGASADNIAKNKLIKSQQNTIAILQPAAEPAQA